MAIFGPRAWVNPFGKISIFPGFEVLVFFSLERRFFVLQYRKTYFPGLYCPPKKLEKWPFLDQYHRLTRYEKSQFFEVLKFLFLQPRKSLFCSRILLNTFSWPILPKTIVGIMAIFGPKAWVNPFGKISIVRLFYFLFLQVFLFQNIVKHIFLAYIAKQKQEKWPFLDQDLGLTPLENIFNFRLFELLFFKAQKCFFFLLEYRKTHFPGLYCLKKTSYS